MPLSSRYLFERLKKSAIDTSCTFFIQVTRLNLSGPAIGPDKLMEEDLDNPLTPWNNYLHY